MDKVYSIRQLFYEQGKKIAEIIEETGHDRKTIVKYLDQTDFNLPEPEPEDPETICPKLDAFKPVIDGWILQYKDRYNGAVLEECCTRAMKANRPYYSYIKNTVANVAEELKVEPCSKAEIKNTEPKKGGITAGRPFHNRTATAGQRTIDRRRPQNANKEEAKKIIKEAGMAAGMNLTDEELDQVAGGVRV